MGDKFSKGCAWSIIGPFPIRMFVLLLQILAFFFAGFHSFYFIFFFKAIIFGFKEHISICLLIHSISIYALTNVFLIKDVHRMLKYDVHYQQYDFNKCLYVGRFLNEVVKCLCQPSICLRLQVTLCFNYCRLLDFCLRLQVTLQVAAIGSHTEC